MAAAVYRFRLLFGRNLNKSLQRRSLYFNSSSKINSTQPCVLSKTLNNSNFFPKHPRESQVPISLNQVPALRLFSTDDKKLSLEEITEKVLSVCKVFDKIPSDKLTVDSHFMNDLGLDSLDHVELIMNIEDDFNFEIPDGDAEKLLRPKDIIAYIEQKEASSTK